ncbi:MAG: diguanylate cyclase [Planctomycetia bacterium]
MNSVRRAEASTSVLQGETSSKALDPFRAPMNSFMQTDTNGVLIRMLSIAEDARRDQTSTGERSLMPRDLISMVLRAMRIRDPAGLLHGQRIAVISSGVANLLGWTDEQRRQLEVAANLHDIGKLGIPDHILRKPGKLSSEEYDFVLQHQHAGVNMLQALHTDPTVVSMLTTLHHDLSGAGHHVEGHVQTVDLPLGPKILAVADAYDSLSTSKPYRRGMTHSECITAMQEKSGQRFDENVIRTLNRWYETEGNTLFRLTESFHDPERHPEVTAEQRDEVAMLAQFIHLLFQFQHLYDGYYILDTRENYCIWSDGMHGITGLPVQNVLRRTWQTSDVLLSPLTEEQASPPERDDTLIAHALKNGRPHFGSRLCRVSGTRHLKVDVYTLPITGPGNKIYGVAQLLRNRSGVRRKSREIVELQIAATRDPLTGVANRGQLETQLRHLLDDFQVQEGTRSLSTIFLDVDHFKRINDTHGHQVGDQVLVDLARLLQHETYSAEIIGRYGGEEFVIICPDTDLDAAVRRAERLRQTIMKSSIGGTSTLSVTSSFGVSTARSGDTVQSLLERADHCLYNAKATGRNRTCRESEPVPGSQVEAPAAEDDKTQLSEQNGLYKFSDRISVSTSLELTGMKLRAFITEYGGIVVDQETGKMQIQLGTPGFFQRWGKSAARQPVEITISFETTRFSTSAREKARIHRVVTVDVKSRGKVPNMDVFAARCLSLIRDLKAFLQGT